MLNKLILHIFVRLSLHKRFI